ncbi:hypothetical protein TEQG_07905 [Trichophyton equinum CBS 127.97]|uniref:Uncharacterized protein n=1 Tax=Trichophyton equinum (strain ATCC MYA-4606 / CBS 127.97) TaxID=559882 RepID=F2Q482_TRIEC|nr:hypothetical protein TEQG_07905 [Trichophyton equinum CBS 127.97]
MSTGSREDHETSRRGRKGRRKTESRSRANPCRAQMEIDRGVDGGRRRDEGEVEGEGEDGRSRLKCRCRCFAPDTRKGRQRTAFCHRSPPFSASTLLRRPLLDFIQTTTTTTTTSQRKKAAAKGSRPHCHDLQPVRYRTRLRQTRLSTSHPLVFSLVPPGCCGRARKPRERDENQAKQPPAGVPGIRGLLDSSRTGS